MSYNITLLTDWRHVVNHSITKKAVFFFSLSPVFFISQRTVHVWKVFFYFLDEYSQKQRLLLVNVTNKHSRHVIYADVMLFMLHYHVAERVACPN